MSSVGKTDLQGKRSRNTRCQRESGIDVAELQPDAYSDHALYGSVAADTLHHLRAQQFIYSRSNRDRIPISTSYLLYLKEGSPQKCGLPYSFELSYRISVLPSVAVGEDRCAHGRQASLSACGRGKSSSPSCGIFPSLRRRCAPAILPEATDLRSGISPHNIIIYSPHSKIKIESA